LAICMLHAFTGSDLVQAGPTGFVFWTVAALLPVLRDERRMALLAGSAIWMRPVAGGRLASNSTARLAADGSPRLQ
jgi:hypothetical protein